MFDFNRQYNISLYGDFTVLGGAESQMTVFINCMYWCVKMNKTHFDVDKNVVETS